MSVVREFQTAGAEQRKGRSAKLVLVVGLQTRDVRLDVMAGVHVDWRGSVVDLVRQDGQQLIRSGAYAIAEPLEICIRAIK